MSQLHKRFPNSGQMDWWNCSWNGSIPRDQRNGNESQQVASSRKRGTVRKVTWRRNLCLYLSRASDSL